MSWEGSSSDGEVDKSKAEFYAQVLFLNLAEFYPTNAHVQCRYEVRPTLYASSRDWIGLFKVGWSSVREYVYFHWVTIPSDYITGNRFYGEILFMDQSLPKDDGEYYQFCYVTSQGHVRGASTPFQFCKPGCDDLVTIEDEDCDILFVTTKTVVLEERLAKVSAKLKESEAAMNAITSVKMLVDEKLDVLQKKLEVEKKGNECLSLRNQDLAEKIAALENEVNDVALARESAQEKASFVNKEKDEILKRLEDNEIYISALQSKIKALLLEKDTLTGNQKDLEKDRENYKEMLSVAEEKLKNAEDKFMAAEHCKIMLNEEILAIQDAHDKMANSLERSHEESHSLKKELYHQAEINEKNADLLRAEMMAIQDENEELLNKEKEHLQKHKSFEEQLEESKVKTNLEEEGAHYALKLAQVHLEKTLAKYKKKYDELKTHLDETRKIQRSQLETEQDLREEIEDLKERLAIGVDEFKKKSLECKRLQRDLKKMKRQSSEDTQSVASQSGESFEQSRDYSLEIVDLQTASRESTPRESTPKPRAVRTEMESGEKVPDTETEPPAYLFPRRSTSLEKRRELASAPAWPPSQWLEKVGSPSPGNSIGEPTRMLTELDKFDASSRARPTVQPGTRMQRLPMKHEPQMQESKVTPLRSMIPVCREVGVVNTHRQLCREVPQLTPPTSSIVFPMVQLTASSPLQYRQETKPECPTLLSLSGKPALVDTQADQQEEDKYEDANGEPQKICPVCTTVFPADVAQFQFEDHVESHYGPVCPVCYKQFPDECENSVFEEHVHSHFD